MSELLLEVGCEELPANAVESASNQLTRSIVQSLQDEGLCGEDASWKAAATPRRLIVSVSGVLERQPDRTESRRGPSAKAAYLPDGSASPALQGFCRSAGVDPASVTVKDDYTWAELSVEGKPATEVLQQILPRAIQSIAFDKTMRWGSGRMRFARPIRWILAVNGGIRVPFSLEGIESSVLSRGHRFLHPASFEAKSFDELTSELQERGVVASIEERKRLIRELVGKNGSMADAHEDLLEENANLVEMPMAIVGEFRNQFLDLPDCVLLETMAKHLRFFPIREDGKLTNRFVSITNGKDTESVVRGNEWVLNARFNDALFFFEEDKKHTLDQFLEMTGRITFQESLGSIRQRADRLSRLCRSLAEMRGADPSLAASCERAGLYAKADFSTGLVSELASLQGRIGGEYAKREGFPQEIVEGISRQYAAPSDPRTPGDVVATVIMCADAADRLAGFLAIGEKPSGSSDPYALRRAATQMIEAQLACRDWAGSPWDWIQLAMTGYKEQGIALKQPADIEPDVQEVFEGRYEALLSDIAHDARAAAWSAKWDDTASRFAARSRLLENLSKDVPFVRVATRPGNIVSAAIKKGIGIGVVNPLRLTEEVERKLHAAIEALTPEVEMLSAEFKFNEIAEKLRTLAGMIDSFFDTVMVMVEDESVRDARLGLLFKADRLFKTLGDFDKIVIQGD